MTSIAIALIACASGATPKAEAPSESAVRRETRVFDITFLTEHIPDFPLRGPARMGGLLLRAPDFDERGGEGGFAFGEEEVYAGVAREEAPGASTPPWTRIDPESLVDLIRRNVDEDSWANARNTIEADEEVLTIHQTPETLDAIERLLASLRARRARMIAVEIAVVPVESLDESLWTGSPWSPAEAFDRIVERAGARATRLEITAYDGQLASAHAGERRAVLRDMEINQTGAAAVPNPVIEAVPVGTIAEARPRSIADTDWIAIDLRVIRRDFAGEPEKEEGPFGEREDIRIAEQALSTSVLARAGQAVLAGFLRSEGEAGSSLAALARVQPFSLRGEEAPGAELPEGLSLRIYDIGFILRSPDASADCPAGFDELAVWIQANIEPGSWNDERMRIEARGSQLTIVQKASAHGAIRETLARWRKASTRLVSIETWTLQGKGSAANAFARLASPGGKLPDTWAERAKELGLAPASCARLIGLPGEEMSAHGWISRTYVPDYECISGGSGFVLTEIPDPIVQYAGTGVEFTFRAALHPGSLASLSIDTVQAKTRFERTAVFQAPWQIHREGEVDPGKPDAPPKAKRIFVPVKIDLPSQDAWRIDRDVPIALGSPLLVEIRCDGPADAPARITIARVLAWRGEEPGPPPPPAPAAAAGEMRQARVFDISRICAHPDWEGSGPSIPGPIPLRSPDGIDEEDEEQEEAALLPSATWDSGGPLEIDAEELIDMLATCVAEDTWENERNRILYSMGFVTIVQTPDVLAEIETFLAPLQAYSLRRVEIEVALVPETGEFDEAVAAAGDEAIVWRASAAPGEGLSLDPVARDVNLSDYEVNQTGVSPSRSAVVRLLEAGLCLRARASATPIDGLFELDLDLGLQEAGLEPERRSTLLGDLDLPERGGTFLGVSVPVREGRTILAGAIHSSAGVARSLAIIARVRSASSPPPESAAVRILDAGPLFRPRVGFEEPERFGSQDEKPKPLYDEERLEAILRADLPQELRADPRLRIRVGRHVIVTVMGDRQATTRAADSISSTLRRLYERHAAAAEIRLRLASLAPADLPKIKDPAAGPTLLAKAWRDAVPLEREVRIDLAGLAGHPVALWSGRGRDYVADIEKVSGGTGWVLAQEPDPIISWAGTGIEVRGLVRPVPGTPWAQVWTRGAAAETTFAKTLEFRAEDRVEIGGPEGIVPIGAKIAIDLPRQSSQVWKHVLTIPDGRAALLAACPDPRDASKVRIIAVEARILPLAMAEPKRL